MSDIVARKTQHITLARDDDSQGNNSYWDNYDLPIKSLPEVDLNNVDTSVELLGKKISQPLIIASMTGGTEHAETINRNLALAAEACHVAMGVGSQRVALEKDVARKSFEIVRKLAPTTVIFANMGAVQLNYGHTVDSYQKVVDMIEADGLYLHINAMQEAMQPEGDINWDGLMRKIGFLIKKIKVPVWVKEVGCGIDPQTARKLIDIGVSGIDVAGVGGTSWTWIEGKREGNELITEWFKNWGMQTDDLVMRINEFENREKISLVASGGIRNPVHGFKAVLLGADYYSAARPFLDTALVSTEDTIKLISDWQRGIKLAMFGCGMSNFNIMGNKK